MKRLLLTLLAFALTGQALANAPLTLDEVLGQLDARMPLLLAAAQDPAVAEARRLSAAGAFDLQLSADAKAVPIGDYSYGWLETSLVQPLPVAGVELAGGYRASGGELPSYYGAHEMPPGGEAWIGASLPLLQDLLIDDRRAELRLAELGVDVAEAKLSATRIKLTLKATLSYWKWLAAGAKVDLAEELLSIAEARDAAIATRVRLGQLPELDQVDNQRIIVERRAKLADARRDLVSAQVELSLYLRDEDGRPVRPAIERLPPERLTPPPPGVLLSEDLVSQALGARPELAAQLAKLTQAETKARLAQNDRAPKLALKGEVSQAVAQSTATTPTELAVGVGFEVPLQRREAAGKLATAQAEIQRAEAELRWLEDRIAADVEQAAAAVDYEWQRWQAAQEAVELARQLEEAEQRRFELGATDLLTVYLREQAFADSVRAEVEAWLEVQAAVATLRAALGVAAIPAPST
ncbi:MAG: TolC family protein [Alphaproteobacteria bacterium]|nr:TolC family protein [Alphaproteobacteria bacterium]MCB9792654.1 TolC family protein [Alphaproteobacteria bacterium]